MAAAVAAAWPQVDLSGLVVTRVGHAVPTAPIVVAQASHPVPEAAGEAAARRILALAEAAGPDDPGAGAGAAQPARTGLTPADKQVVTTALLRSGATIDEMNQVPRLAGDQGWPAGAGGVAGAAAHPGHQRRAGR